MFIVYDPIEMDNEYFDNYQDAKKYMLDMATDMLSDNEVLISDINEITLSVVINKIRVVNNKLTIEEVKDATK